MAIQFSPEEILETIRMVQMENLDIRTITIGISLRNCADPSLEAAARNLREDLPLGRTARRRRRRDRARVRHSDHQQARLRDADRARRGSVGERRLRAVRRIPRARGRRRRHQLPRRLLGARAQGTTPGDDALIASIPERSRAPSASARRSTSRRHAPASTWTPWRAWAKSSSRLRSARPIATASAARSSSCSATPSRTTRSWPARSTASASPTASSTSASAAPASSRTRSKPSRTPTWRTRERHQAHGVQDHAHGRARGPRGIGEARRAVRHRRSVARADAGARRQRRARAASDGLERVGTHGSTAALALLNDAVKKGGAMASSHVGGLRARSFPCPRTPA